jgi:4-hydroxybenzoate polyprenyltransferase
MLVFFLVIALLLGPLRRPVLKHARFTIPAIAGGVVGFLLGSYVATMAGLPPPLAALLSLVAAGALALNLGEASKDWFDRTFGKKNGPPTP